MPEHELVLTTKAHLQMKEAILANSYPEALALRRAAEEILSEQIQRKGAEDEYPYHVFLSQMLHWLNKWEDDKERRRDELKKLQEVADSAIRNHYYSKRIQAVVEEVKYTCLSLTLPTK